MRPGLPTLLLFFIILALVIPVPKNMYADNQEQNPRNHFPGSPKSPDRFDGKDDLLQQAPGLILNDKGTFDGYTLFAPVGSTKTYLIDMQGKVINEWQSQYPPGQSAYLLENGNLLRTASVGPENSYFFGGGAGGRIQEFNWDGQLLWDFEHSSEKHLSHHDIKKLPNGNVLIIAWELKTQEDAIAAGRDPQIVGDKGLWSDYIIEVKPTGKTTGQIVWQWHVWDHLIQDFDPRKENYGPVDEHPELINLNPPDWMNTLSSRQRNKLESLGYLSSRHSKIINPDWNHANSIAYNPKLDQIVLSVLGFNEIWIIDHSTTTEQAAGHTAGKYGKGGDLLYRWGNPRSYGAGDSDDQMLFAQHDSSWISDGLPGAGHILIFNNGRGRKESNYSSVDEIVLPVNKNGTYKLKKGRAFGPAKPVWTYKNKDENRFFSINVSGAQRLPNGNTFICSGADGTLFEVDKKGKILWKYINPIQDKKAMRRPGITQGSGKGIAGNLKPPPKEFIEQMKKTRRPPKGMPMLGGGGLGRTIFKAYRYGPDYPGLADKDLTPGKTIEQTQK